MDAAFESSYRARFQRVLEHIDRHLDGDLSVRRLSAVAAFSRFHFQRQFAAMYGIGVHQYVTLRRLKRASYQLAFHREVPIIDVCLASGYEAPESFSRAFRRTFRQSPSAFRRNPDWQVWHDIYPAQSAPSPGPSVASAVQIVSRPATQVAALEHRGDPRRLQVTLRAFIAWRKRNRLIPPASATYNILYDDPGFRLDLCAGTERPVLANDEGVVAKTLPAGRCAMFEHRGSDDGLRQAIRSLYADWLPRSGEEPGAFPIYLQRVRWFPESAESEARSLVFLPLR